MSDQNSNNRGTVDVAGARAMNLVHRDELHEVQVKQALFEKAIEQISASTAEIATSVREFTSIAAKFQEVLPMIHNIEAMADRHETELAVLRSHDVVRKIADVDREMPGLKQARNWVVGGMVGIVCLVGAALVALVVKTEGESAAHRTPIIIVKNTDSSVLSNFPPALQERVRAELEAMEQTK